jgi:hypothetical protein
MPASYIHIETVLIKTIEQIRNNPLAVFFAGKWRAVSGQSCGAFASHQGGGKTIVEWPDSPQADTTEA